MHRICCVLLLLMAAGCATESLAPPRPATQPAAKTTTGQATPEQLEAALRKVNVQAFVAKGNRLLAEGADERARQAFQEALDLDRHNAEAREGLKTAEQRLGLREVDLLDEYHRLIRIVQQATIDEVNGYLAGARRHANRDEYDIALEKVAAASLAIDARRRAFNAAELRDLRERVRREKARILLERQAYERQLERLRHEELGRMEQERLIREQLERRRRIERLLEIARQYSNQRRYDLADKVLDQVLREQR
jgi:tetratricopeptide (TPR) repeat protein